MERRNNEVHVTQDEGRSGSTPHIVRYVLIFGLALAILALTAIWVTGAVSTNEANEDAEYAGQAPSTRSVQ